MITNREGGNKVKLKKKGLGLKSMREFEPL